MMLSQNEIRLRAGKFAEEWKNDSYEKGEAQSFYNEFFHVFGVSRHTVALFELGVKKLDDTHGFIDLFWEKKLIAEHKSTGLDLDNAIEQATEYCLAIKEDVRPQYMLACDFQNFLLIDLAERKEHRFKLSEFPNKIELFGFMIDTSWSKPNHQDSEDAVNIEAVQKMAQIYDTLKESGYETHDSEYLLTRLTFCMFADDTGIFDPHGRFANYLQDRTAEDGSDLGSKMTELFQVLNTDYKTRQSNLDEDLAQFPYINGDLFKNQIRIPAFNSKMRELFIDACKFDWSKISPAIFGSLFQSVMRDEERRKKGAHYTTEINILKIIKPLFLDALTDEFESIKSRKDSHRKKNLEKFQDRLANLTFFDPACGSGNFLIIAYREIRKLELKIIRELHDTKQHRMDVSILSKIHVDKFYGIEFNEFSARIAETALWMMDHLMNNELSMLFGISYTRIPLKKSPNIVNADALEIDWNEVLPSSKCSYILGNPPFGGSKVTTVEQRNQIKRIANLGKSGGTLDYVTGWFLKAADYVNKQTTIGFVATNSITQGEQVGQLWPILFKEHGLEIIFAHRPFKWESDARGKAIVTVVILGLAKKGRNSRKLLFHYDDDENILEENPTNISPYLFGTKNPPVVVLETSTQLNEFPRMLNGSQPIDGGNYIFTNREKEEFLSKEPNAKPFLKPFIQAHDYLHNEDRWILDLHDIEPKVLQNLPETKKRIALVKLLRSKSKRGGTRKLAETPKLWQINLIPKNPFLVFPRHSSEKRDYVPIGYLEPPCIPGDATLLVENASIELFGLLTSKIHMVWLRGIGGQLESRLRYSVGMVYNTFPTPTGKLESIERYAQKILDVRAGYDDSLADLYDPYTMPPDLKKAHRRLDHEVEKLYRKEPFQSDYERLEYLLEKYEKMLKGK